MSDAARGRPRGQAKRVAIAAILVAAATATAAALLREAPQPPAPPEPPPQPAAGPTFRSLGDRVVVSNDDGDWTIYLRCRSAGGRTVGPGYVSRLVTSSGDELVDDVLPPGTLNDPTFGGLGAFGWHHARGRPGALTLGRRNAWEVSGRDCARRNRGFGVVASRLLQPPRAAADEAGNAFLGFAIDVLFGDAFTTPRPILRVRYRYRFYDDVVRSWIAVRQLCGHGRCGRTRALAFVKEPKLVAHARWPFTRMATFDTDGVLRCIYTSGGGPTGPILATGQCAHDERARVRFDYGSATSGEAGGCRDRPCLEIGMRAYPVAEDDGDVTPGRESVRWESSTGLDGWAVASAGRESGRSADTRSIDGVLSDCLGGTPRTQRARRWETTGRLRGRRYISLGALFPAWEGGRGGYDCEPLSRLFGPFGETWGVAASYSVATGADELP